MYTRTDGRPRCRSEHRQPPKGRLDEQRAQELQLALGHGLHHAAAARVAAAGELARSGSRATACTPPKKRFCSRPAADRQPSRSSASRRRGSTPGSASTTPSSKWMRGARHRLLRRQAAVDHVEHRLQDRRADAVGARASRARSRARPRGAPRSAPSCSARARRARGGESRAGSGPARPACCSGACRCRGRPRRSRSRSSR